jgi:rare lipoprotein A (peptidoglycan hydrolase)
VACPGGTRGAKYVVAHKTLPCGTMVTLRYRGRTVRAKVVDRGPFVGGREFDLDAGTKAALRAGDLTTIMSNR